jgi:hypothetical protein
MHTHTYTHIQTNSHTLLKHRNIDSHINIMNKLEMVVIFSILGKVI